jgi:hypothetical protein
VAAVDPEDDSITRYVVRRYQFDAARHERRHVVIGAFDNEAEYEACIEAAAAELRRRRDDGDEIHPTEHVSGVALEPGYLRRAANGHLLRRAIEHGAVPDKWLDSLELPRNMALLRYEEPLTRWGRVRRWIRQRRR